MFYLFLGVLFVSLLFVPKLGTVQAARENVTDWYIQKIDAEFVVSADSTMVVTENITADCGNLPDKHGIFRVLPTKIYKTANEEIETPIYLKSITDFNGVPYKYQETKDSANNTITWKIGDAGKTVRGVNNYKITYDVKNVIRLDNPSFDEFYWNLNGAFWDIETDEFSANVVFPDNFNQKDSQVSLYSGAFETKDNTLADYNWENSRILIVKSKKTLASGDGITVSVTAPKDVFTPYVLSGEDNNYYSKSSLIDWNLKKDYPTLYWVIAIFGMILPFVVFIICFSLWRKYGDDPKFDKAIVPEFGIPNNLAPIEMGLVMSNGKMENQYLTAGIINLAVKGFIKIEKIAKKGILSQEDYKLILLNKNIDKLAISEQSLLKKLVNNDLTKKEVLLSDLKYSFAEEVKNIASTTKTDLRKNNLINEKGKNLRTAFLILAIVSFSVSTLLTILSGWLYFGVLLSILIIIIFAIIMPRRTFENLELLHRIKGFELYMKTAEKYRQKFNEKENILEKFLPYAILFNMTGLWISKMKDIYGEKYVANYTPVWFYGGAIGAFNIDTFNSTISSFSEHMSQTMISAPSSSGFGGGGFSGGGGGGGGGGGW